MWGLNKVIFSGDRSNVGFGIIQRQPAYYRLPKKIKTAITPSLYIAP